MPDQTSDQPPDPTADQAPDQPDRSPETQTEAPPHSGRRRLVAALITPSRQQLVVAVLLALVGFAAITQVRATSVDTTYAGYREQDLIDVLNGLAGTSQRAQSEIRRLERTRNNLRSDTEARQAALDQARTESDTLNILAGLVPVTGSGIRITIKEVSAPVQAEPLIDLVQELRTAGAEAIQVNGQVRLVAQSSFEDADGGILVDGELLPAPYVIDVIGEPSLLAGAVTFINGPKYQLERDGAEVVIDQLTSLDIESVREARQPEYAVPEGQQ